jgi:hypothetical protein
MSEVESPSAESSSSNVVIFSGLKWLLNFGSCLRPIPASIKILRFPSCTSKHRIAQVHILFESASLSFDHRDLGTTPNIAPPSSLNLPASIMCILVIECVNYTKPNFSILENSPKVIILSVCSSQSLCVAIFKLSKKVTSVVYLLIHEMASTLFCKL